MSNKEWTPLAIPICFPRWSRNKYSKYSTPNLLIPYYEFFLVKRVCGQFMTQSQSLIRTYDRKQADREQLSMTWASVMMLLLSDTFIQ